MKTASAIQENAEDIYAEAQQINEDRAAAEEVVEDTADEAAEETEETTDSKKRQKETEEGSEGIMKFAIKHENKKDESVFTLPRNT